MYTQEVKNSTPKLKLIRESSKMLKNWELSHFGSRYWFPVNQATCAYLMRSPSWDEDGIPNTLSNGPPLHTILLVQPLPKVKVQVEQLVVNWISAWCWPKTPFLVNLTKRGEGGQKWLGEWMVLPFLAFECCVTIGGHGIKLLIGLQ